MKVGTVCFATERGLGYMSKSFYDHGIITDVMVVRHGGIPTHMEWYPGATEITSLRSGYFQDKIKEFATSMDVMLFIETPFWWEVIPHCRKVGTTTALITMYECTPDPIPHAPDLYICPSPLDTQYFPNNSVELPIPVDEPWEERTRAIRFVHNSGYIGLRGRNGTLELMQAMEHVQSDLKLTIRSQTKELNQIIRRVPSIEKDDRVTIEIGTVPYNQLRSGFDVCVAPEKFNGLSLPLQEAHASGMLVMTTNRWPANGWLPTEPMIPVSKTIKSRNATRFFEMEECVIDPKDIATTMDKWYGRDISGYSAMGKFWAEDMAWDSIKPRYIEVLQNAHSIRS